MTNNAFVIYAAKKIITMCPSQPEATHVAVRDGKILAVGSLEELQGWGEYILDQTFADKIIVPGLVEAHSHATGGGMWQFPYVGYYDRPDYTGKVWKGCRSFDEVVAALKIIESEMTDPDAPLIAWGVDPIYFGSEKLGRKHLDQVSTTRPVAVIHMSIHLMGANTCALHDCGIYDDCAIEGVVKNDDGTLHGELVEFAAMGPILDKYGFWDELTTEKAIRNFGQEAFRAGCTSAADMGLTDFSNPELTANYIRMTRESSFPIRLLVAYGPPFVKKPFIEAIDFATDVMKHGHEKMIFGPMKIFLDGSIQGGSGRMLSPGYYQTGKNGAWNATPEQVDSQVYEIMSRGYQVHCHCNGDEASEAFIQAVEKTLNRIPAANHRATMQHAQMLREDQFRRIKTLGMCVNFFSNHIYYWGDQHYAKTMGPERAKRMNACGSAVRHGIPFAFHSDCGITPVNPLFTGWCAVNRLTASGRTLGEYEKISVEQALYGMTLGAAYTMKADHLIGSIECGKYADFTILEEDPLAINPVKLKDIGVWGTVLGGRVQPIDA
ncbi:N-substituted formamide deformylase precursor [Buttiauxella agrestis]|uniref:N-substituted formamide deformylase n=1 Tax=Buttiauxella agrestis TaxID=82977 RepID=A0A381C239_9ENTR|nr:amidohydrolase [Buttiauxella agrestis]SUW61897.1 N-substituted formamide deformylase precursor [Buttiauxella agrestis]